MALGIFEDTRELMLDTITTRAGASALLQIYDSTGTGRPATGGAVTSQVKLAELVCNATFAPAAGGVTPGDLILNAIADDTSADATGTATWFRLYASNGTTFVMDGDVATSASDINFDTVSFVIAGTVSVTSFVITAGNA